MATSTDSCSVMSRDSRRPEITMFALCLRISLISEVISSLIIDVRKEAIILFKCAPIESILFDKLSKEFSSLSCHSCGFCRDLNLSGISGDLYDREHQKLKDEKFSDDVLIAHRRSRDIPLHSI